MIRTLLCEVSFLAMMLVNPFISFPAAGGGTSYANAGGTGDRTATITATSNSCCNAGIDSNFIDGASADNSTDSRDFHSNVSGSMITFDFGVGVFQNVDEITWYQSGTNTHGAWEVEAGNDGIAFVLLKTSFTLGGSTGANVISFTNTGFYRYYRLRQTYNSGNASSSPWLREVEFKLVSGASTTVVTNILSYGNRGGSGVRGSVITVTTTAAMGGGSTIDKLVNGTAFRGGTDNATDSCFFSGGESTREVKFDFGGSYSPIIEEFTWFQDGVGNHGTWKIAGSNDDSAYTDILTGFTLGGAAVATYAMTNSTAYRYYKLIQTAGSTSSGPWLREIWFKLRS